MNWELIAEHKEHIKGYGFISDLLGKTIYGIDKSIVNKYDEFKEEFIEDTSLPKHVVDIIGVPHNEIPCGTLKIYGRRLEEDYVI